ncbi:MAG: hypothetical protein AAB512_04545 [Patescibacteria group bacterium]
MKLVNSSWLVVHGKKTCKAVKTINHQLSTTNYPGQILVFGLIFIAVVLILTASLFGRTADLLRFGSGSVTGEEANSLSEAGIERALWQLNQTAGAYSGETNTALGTTGTFTVTVANKSSNLKTVTATGYVPNATSPKNKRVIKLDVGIDNTIIEFNYAVQVGTGGVDMENSATITGTVYSNKTGAGSISGTGSSRIVGNAYAVGTITTPDPTVTGTKHQNQTASQMPTLDYQYWQDAATAGGITNCTGTCSISSGSPNLGPQKYIGNLTLSNTATAIMNGPIYVTGDVTIQNSASLKLNNSFGSSGSVLIVGGKIVTANSGGFTPTSSSPKGYILVATTSTASDAVKIQNSGVNAIFYALDGGSELSNSAQVTALVSKSMLIKNSASLTYDSGLASAQFTTGPGGSWQIIKGTYKYSN